MSRSKPLLVDRRQFRHCCVPAEVNGRLQAVVPYADILKAPVVNVDKTAPRSKQISCVKISGNNQVTFILDDLDAEVIKALANNRMNAAETARQLFMHRNSVGYHISKVKKQIGLDPRDFFDLHKLLEQL